MIEPAQSRTRLVPLLTELAQRSHNLRLLLKELSEIVQKFWLLVTKKSPGLDEKEGTSVLILSSQ